MKIETRAIDSLRPDSRNARKHGARNLATIRASLEQFGQRRAAVVRSDGTVLAGNGMLEAARSIGWTELSVTVVPDEWSDEEARAYALADNRTGELAEWDVAVLDDHITELQVAGLDVDALGFDADSLSGLVGAKPGDDDWKDAFGATDKDASDFQQMTFVLHVNQVEAVKAALDKANALGDYDSENHNKNGNALSRVCETFLTMVGNNGVG
ncbi:MAG TPA: ParB/Srx family N-terminal domain-containing protein [Acidimicrobiia bacterium]